MINFYLGVPGLQKAHSSFWYSYKCTVYVYKYLNFLLFTDAEAAEYVFICIINRPGVAGAVLKAASSLINRPCVAGDVL